MTSRCFASEVISSWMLLICHCWTTALINSSCFSWKWKWRECLSYLVIGIKLRFLECLHNLHVSTYREEKKQSTVASLLNIFAASRMIKQSRDLRRRRPCGLCWPFKSGISGTGRISVFDGFIPASSPALGSHSLTPPLMGSGRELEG